MKNTKPTTTTKSIISEEKLRTAFKLVAYSSLIENKKEVNFDNIENEASRIERCVEHYYKIDKEVKYEFSEFASLFLTSKFKEIVFGETFRGNFIDDIGDGKERSVFMSEYSILK